MRLVSPPHNGLLHALLSIIASKMIAFVLHCFSACSCCCSTNNVTSDTRYSLCSGSCEKGMHDGIVISQLFVARTIEEYLVEL